MIKTKRIFDLWEESDGFHFVVTRKWPMYATRERLHVTDWIKCLGPSEELLNDWKEGIITWAAYTRRYKKEMQQQKDAIQSLAKLAANETITLLCYEKEGDPHCHRYILKELIEDAIRSVAENPSSPPSPQTEYSSRRRASSRKTTEKERARGPSGFSKARD